MDQALNKEIDETLNQVDYSIDSIRKAFNM